uniref:DM2 domain-containing protein n=1 Tax=viral metagenome TaxID=1070528 RepID=A0A6C0HHC9_9ZZZZ
MVKTNSKTTATATATESTATAPVQTPVKEQKAPKAPKTPKVVASEVSVSVSAPVAVVADVPATPKKVKAAKAPKVSAPAPAPESVPVPVVAESSPVVADAPQVSNDFSSFSAKLQQVSALLSALKTEFRSLERKSSRELKTATKAGAKKKRKTGNRSPSGFVKPTLISSELATFLGKTQGTEMARTEVTREINAYIRANSLQDKTNGRKINADSKLSSLLKLKADEELTYFNLQRYMSPHFQKAAAALAAAALSTSAVVA